MIKTLKEKLNAYISDINNNKYIPITFEKINKIKLYNNFSKNTIEVPNRDTTILYIENSVGISTDKCIHPESEWSCLFSYNVILHRKASW